MPKFTDVNTLPYTPEELEYFEKEMRAYRLHKYVKFWKKAGVPFIRYTFLPAVIIIVVFGLIQMSDRNYGQWDWMWTMDKIIALTYIAGFGLWTLTSHITELISTNKLRRRLGIKNKWHFQVLVIAFQITGMD